MWNCMLILTTMTTGSSTSQEGWAAPQDGRLQGPILPATAAKMPRGRLGSSQASTGVLSSCHSSPLLQTLGSDPWHCHLRPVGKINQGLPDQFLTNGSPNPTVQTLVTAASPPPNPSTELLPQPQEPEQKVNTLRPRHLHISGVPRREERRSWGRPEEDTDERWEEEKHGKWQIK